MMVRDFLLVVFAAGSNPPVHVQVPDLPTLEACQKLGEELAADMKRANGSMRYRFSCYEIAGDALPAD
ncbi:hypothetical protein [Croceicoccus gelatinilyticus]|uniref:hypothetical protein n=1 Tax=Croceicoccus gelatinilyticus TaxID=2835536 RepID=UPI001BD14159|nr:hypothetical protein [Croceicoccus gelatinilyticus]MBS7671500.1 hypothetical protein [Croceicoccus gelatinilyticus]